MVKNIEGRQYKIFCPHVQDPIFVFFASSFLNDTFKLTSKFWLNKYILQSSFPGNDLDSVVTRY